MTTVAVGAETKTVEKNATCTFCGCVCDDMVLTVESGIRKAKECVHPR